MANSRSHDSAAPPTEMEDRVDNLLAQVLRGHTAPWPGTDCTVDLAQLVAARIAFHGVGGLLWAFRQRLDGWPQPLLDSLRAQNLALAMWEMQHKAALAAVIAALDEEHVGAIVLKGTALAYCLYGQPHNRLRGDTDLIVPVEARSDATVVLSGLGWERLMTESEDTLFQEAWVRAGTGERLHMIDLHWQATEYPALEDLLPYDTCLAGTCPLPALAPAALRLQYPLMLLHAIVHRRKHATAAYIVDGTQHHEADRLIWLYDFDLLVRAMDERDWTRFCELADSSGVGPVCTEGLESCMRWLDTPVPQAVLHRLTGSGASARSDYLLKDSKLVRTWKNFKAISGLRPKAAYLKARLFPPAPVMRRKYGEAAGTPLPALYVRRIIEGLIKREM